MKMFVFRCVVSVFAIALLATAAQAVTIDLVSVGNTGNYSDPATSHGSVHYNYKISKYEVTTGQYLEFLNAVAKTDTYGLYSEYMWTEPLGCKIQQNGSAGNYNYTIGTGGAADNPVNFVDWGSAARFANWLRNGQKTGLQDNTTTEDGSYYLNGATTDAELAAITRKAGASWVIPTEDEWYKAAYHKNDGNTDHYYLYPTSHDSTPSNAIVNPDPGNNANSWRNGNVAVGTFENSGSPYGTFDQGGNVAEWTEAVTINSPPNPSTRRLRGGHAGGNTQNMKSSEFYASPPTTQSWGAGIRLAFVPEPGSIALLLSGLLCLCCTRRRRS